MTRAIRCGWCASSTGLCVRCPICRSGGSPQRTWRRRSDFRWRASDGLEIQGWLYEPRGTRSRSNHPGAWRPDRAFGGRLRSGGAVSGGRGFRGAAAELSRLHRFRPAVPGIDQAGWLGRARAGRYRARRIGADCRGYRCCRAASGSPAHPMAATLPGARSRATPPEIIKAAAPICGMTDLVVDYETTRPDLRPYSEEMMGGSPGAGAGALSRAIADPFRRPHPRAPADRAGAERSQRHAAERHRRARSAWTRPASRTKCCCSRTRATASPSRRTARNCAGGLRPSSPPRSNR